MAQQAGGGAAMQIRSSVIAEASYRDARLSALYRGCRTLSSPAEAAAVHPMPEVETAPIQRKVTSFHADTKNYYPPCTDLIGMINHSYFTQTTKSINATIWNSMKDPKKGLTAVPTYIEATVAPNWLSDSTPARKRMSAVVGKIGSDEYWLRSGGTSEIYEGGHLIPHELWTTNDQDVDSADNYDNLVPMSRNMNVNV